MSEGVTAADAQHILTMSRVPLSRGSVREAEVGPGLVGPPSSQTAPVGMLRSEFSSNDHVQECEN